MAIALGRSLTDPSFMLTQIVLTTAVFLLVLGLTACTIDFALYAGFGHSSVPPTSLGTATRSFQMPLWAIFSPYPPDSGPSAVEEMSFKLRLGTSLKFIALHLCASVGSSVPVAYIIQRRRFVMDFSVTLYVVYFMLSWVVVGLPTSAGWFLGVFGGCGVMMVTMNYICAKREAVEIELGISGSAGTPIAVVTSGSVPVWGDRESDSLVEPGTASKRKVRD
jgi:ABC-type sugar transport system permease subunit